MHSNFISFVDKFVVITGGGSGIGKAMTSAFLNEKATVIVLERNPLSIQRLYEDFPDFDKKLFCIEADLTCEDAISDAFQDIATRFGRVDVLINNAGILKFGPSETFGFNDWRQVMSVNLDAVFLISQHALKFMLKQNSGNIINISSTAGMVGSDVSVAYVASKHAVVGLTRALAVEYGARNIRVNAICPGDTRTPMSDEYTEKELKQQIAKHPIARIGTTDEIANVALFLASDQSSFMTGAIVAVDGGYTTI